MVAEQDLTGQIASLAAQLQKVSQGTPSCSLWSLYRSSVSAPPLHSHDGRQTAAASSTLAAHQVQTEQDVPVSPAGSQSSGYNFREIEAKWRHFWMENKTFKTPDLADLDTSKPKFYALDM